MNPKIQMEKVIAGSYHNTAGMVVRKKGDTVYEKYYNGYAEQNTVQIASVTKSIVSALMGIALEQGYIESVDQKVLEYFPDYEVTRGEKSMLEFAAGNLFTPLGIVVRDSITFNSKEEYLVFQESKDQSAWVADQEGFNMAGWGLTLSPVDMAKIGQLYLNDGMWDHRQIIPAKWVDESTREHSRCSQWKYYLC